MTHDTNAPQTEETMAQDALNNPCEELEQQVNELKNKYLRALADYKNLERRMEVREQEIRIYAAENTVRKLLPALDTLQEASKHIKDEGIGFIQKEFIKALEGCQVEKIEVIGKQFDPYEMECIEVIPGAKETVMEEVLAGYKLGEKVIRAAKVKVGNGTKQ